ncbi:MAG: pyruvate, phosphate dikinase [Bacteriovoracales bacterium]|nr:pyruvate, phosphate dikinase [Bacteriovoracales bacterium]
MNMKKWVYRFNRHKVEGNREMSTLLGGKGANLAEMSSLGFCVPPGFTITTEACLDYTAQNGILSEEIKEQSLEAVREVERVTGKVFGDPHNPLLFSVRSGARVSMPGMMDTVLNLGLNDDSVRGLAEQTKDERFAWDSYRRFIQMYANVVLGANTSVLENTLENLKEARGVSEDTDLTGKDWEELCDLYQKMLLRDYGLEFPSDPLEQLWKAMAAVFNSWNNPRAKVYRELNGFSHDWGTAVNVQGMVFGNRGADSGTGVCFTRNPSTGEKIFFGEFLMNAQGEDVVAGIRTPGPINEESKNVSNKHLQTLEELNPTIYGELVRIYQNLESHYRDMQDIEFTVERGKLYILQTRAGKRTAAAALKIAVDLTQEGLISKEEAVMRVRPDDLSQLLHPTLDPKAPKILLAQGLPASPGAACGVVVFSSERACEFKELGKKVILVRHETSPEDINGMVASEGILTAQGGMTSHAAVVARGMGKPCVAGCHTLFIDVDKEELSIGNKIFKTGDTLTINGEKGEVFEGIVPTSKPTIGADFALFMKWADEIRRLKVRANADNPEDSQLALRLGAEGIGLCRTEHMFFAPNRILAVRKMIFAKDKEEREKALGELLPFQKEDFKKIFKVMGERPVNIRLLDPPLHEFMPRRKEEREELALALGIDAKEVKMRERSLHEFNPMLGHRGCRLGITYPEIYEMQVKAIVEAAFESCEEGTRVKPEIMIPLVGHAKELSILKETALKIIAAGQAVHETKEGRGKGDSKVDFKVGTMIELPRAAITAAEIAPYADFFSFGTNDLTQTTLGLSRDDSGKFLSEYVGQSIYPTDPFVSIDQSGVGFLVEHACREGKRTNESIHLGICGEHGGEPASIDFCHRSGLDYVSCSPFRVPIARLAAAQAAIEHGR